MIDKQTSKETKGEGAVPRLVTNFMLRKPLFVELRDTSNMESFNLTSPSLPNENDKTREIFSFIFEGHTRKKRVEVTRVSLLFAG